MTKPLCEELLLVMTIYGDNQYNHKIVKRCIPTGSCMDCGKELSSLKPIRCVDCKKIFLNKYYKDRYVPHKNHINIWTLEKKRESCRKSYLKRKESGKIKEQRLKIKMSPEKHLANILRQKIWSLLKRNGRSHEKYFKYNEVIGCSPEKLVLYLESKWTEGMSWDNYGVHGWHIDHIKPCASFDLSIKEEQQKCFHYTNLQPLWAMDNYKKHDKIL
jgi:hypothetical protein